MSCIYNEILLENLYEEALEICTKRMSVIGSFPWEIKAAAEEMAMREMYPLDEFTVSDVEIFQHRLKCLKREASRL